MIKQGRMYDKYSHSISVLVLAGAERPTYSVQFSILCGLLNETQDEVFVYY